MSDTEVTPEEFAIESPADVQTVRAAFLVLQHAGFRVVRDADSLDAAWAEAEAALPEGNWSLSVSRDQFRPTGRDHRAVASGWFSRIPKGVITDPVSISGEYAPTPDTALRALAERLRGGTG